MVKKQKQCFAHLSENNRTESTLESGEHILYEPTVPNLQDALTAKNSDIINQPANPVLNVPFEVGGTKPQPA